MTEQQYIISQQYMILGYIVALSIPVLYAAFTFLALRKTRRQEESRAEK